MRRRISALILALALPALAGVYYTPWSMKPPTATLNRDIPRVSALIGYWPMLQPSFASVGGGSGVQGFDNLTGGAVLGFGSGNGTVPVMGPCRWGSCFNAGNNPGGNASNWLAVTASAAMQPATFSGEAWFYLTGNPSASYTSPVGQWGGSSTGWMIVLSPTRQCYAQLNGVSTQGSASIVNVGQWYHVVLTYDGATVKLYINGKLDTSAAAATYTPYNLFQAGEYNNGGTAVTMPGNIDLIAYYNRPLTQSEILEQYNFPLSMLKPQSRTPVYLSTLPSQPPPATHRTVIVRNAAGDGAARGASN